MAACGGAHAGDLELVAELALDARDRQHLALVLLEQDRGHEVADVAARHLQQCASALAVERRPTPRAGCTGPGRGCASVSMSPGGHHLAVDDHRCAAADADNARVPNGTGPRPSSAAARLGVMSARRNSSVRGAADDVLGLGGVLHAGQLHHHAVSALLLDHRLGHAQLVDAVVQRGDVLLERLVLHAARGLGAQRAGQLDIAAIGALDPLQVGHLLGQQSLRCAEHRAVSENGP